MPQRAVWAAMAAAGAAIACAGLMGPAPSPAVAYLDDPAALKRGRLLFTGSCGGYCHPTKPGNRDAPYLFDCTWKRGGSDAALFAAISAGIPETRMPAYGGKLPERDRDIWRLVAFIRSKGDCEHTNPAEGGISGPISGLREPAFSTDRRDRR